jgi:hypothetical protein
MFEIIYILRTFPYLTKNQLTQNYAPRFHFIQIRSTVQGIDLLKLQIDHRAGVDPGAGSGAIRHHAA